MKAQRKPDAASSNSRSNSSFKATNHGTSTRRNAKARNRQSGKTPIIKAVLEIAVNMNAVNASVKNRIALAAFVDQIDPTQTWA